MRVLDTVDLTTNGPKPTEFESVSAYCDILLSCSLMLYAA